MSLRIETLTAATLALAIVAVFSAATASVGTEARPEPAAITCPS
jgi:hypothetical protein